MLAKVRLLHFTLTSKQQRKGMYDCIVVGIGGHGSAIVAELAKTGQNVLGIEQFEAVHSKGIK